MNNLLEKDKKNYKKKINKILTFSLPIFFSLPFFFNNGIVKATEDTFSVKKISIQEENIKENPINWYEIDKKKHSGKNIVLMFSLENRSGESKEIVVEPRDAYAQTNQLLNIVYPNIPNLKYSTITDKTFNFKQYIEEQSTLVFLKPGEIKEIKINLEVPKTIGDTLGAISFKEKSYEDKKKEDEKKIGTSFLLENEYIIAVHLINAIQKEKSFIFEKSRPILEPNRFTIEFDVENVNPSVSSQEVNYSILNKDKMVVFHNESPLSFKMSPMSKTSYRITWPSEEVKKGAYFLKINNTLLPFKIKNDEIKKIESTIDSKQIVTIESDNNNRFWFILIVSILLNATLIIFIFRFIRKNK
jgi:hypothetical protein